MGVRTSGFWAHVSAEWQVEALRGGAVMDRAATSDLRIGVDQSRKGGKERRVLLWGVEVGVGEETLYFLRASLCRP